MNITIKSKLSIGIGLLAGFVVLLWISGSIFINTLAENSGAIIEDNIRSVSFAQQMEQSLNDLYTTQISALSGEYTALALKKDSYQKAVKQFDSILDKQESNITETGERALTNQVHENYSNLRAIFESAVQSPPISPQIISQQLPPAYHRVQQNLSQLTTMNVDAIHRKNSIAQQTASNVTIYMSVIGGLCSILGLLMLIRFPSYIVDPIHELIRRIKEIANRNYDQTLSFYSGDEYEELAEAFNRMAGKLQEYENSNLDRIMSEKKRVEAIINHMGDAVMGLDAAKYVLFANDKAIELIGQGEEELVGQYGPDIASHNELFHKIIQALSGEAEEDIGYIKVTDKDEHYYSVEVTQVHHDPNNEAARATHLGNIITLKNVTKFHELDQAKTNFISVVSHELKTPISSINMSLRLLGDKRVGMLNEEQEKLVSSIRKDVHRMKQTTGDLLDLTKIESGNVQLNTRKVNPSNLLEYAYETMIMQASQNDLEIDLQLNESLPRIQADTQKTVWVLVNLISNAIRYTSSGGRITLKAQKNNNSRFVKFTVEDTGEGISADDLNKIFDKYYQVDKNQKDSTGSGLGLSIAKEFIIAQGGRIWAESKTGEGSSFYFTLPISRNLSND
ncbi:PAS/PAC sensor signal transduction histidine kinase [Fodinibius roseus]|uniref:histidine kinase n=1 Tax=Fodinibius roseus TaxID=1194090 RepID=A0A1M5KIB8_9BACT|nr:ATP-binding protein [Fodinibius roseus]SHG52517.1 PAS/PAC sensor signal transduction histidine kinase [Fodinibius roseus]